MRLPSRMFDCRPTYFVRRQNLAAGFFRNSEGCGKNLADWFTIPQYFFSKNNFLSDPPKLIPSKFYWNARSPKKTRLIWSTFLLIQIFCLFSTELPNKNWCYWHPSKLINFFPKGIMRKIKNKWNKRRKTFKVICCYAVSLLPLIYLKSRYCREK